MNVRKFNIDLLILQEKYDQKDALGRVIKYGVDWTDTPQNRIIIVRDVEMPYPRANLKNSNIKIMVPENIYDKAPGGGYYFYQNVFVAPNLKIWHEKKKQYMHIPRHYKADKDGWSFLCIHPNGIVSEEKNVLDFIRILQVYLRNVDPDSI